MAKNTDFFIAQYSLIREWVSPAQLSECMKISRQNTGIPLADILLQKKYLSKKQVMLLLELWQKREQKLTASLMPSTPDKNLAEQSDDILALIPRKFGPYKILSEIGRGGMGVVYKVNHPDIDFPLALKVLIQNEDPSSEIVMRFYREIELASQLRPAER